MSGLAGIASYVPAKRVVIASAQNELNLTCDEIRLLTETHQLQSVAVETKLLVHEMMEMAVDKLLLHDPAIAAHIGLIAYTGTFNPFCPFLYDPLSRIQKKWRLEKAIPWFVTQLNCASIDFLFFLAHQRLSRQKEEAILVLAADKMFIPGSRYLRDSTVSGDAAIAAVMTRKAHENRLICSITRADASIYNSVQSSPDEFIWFQKTYSVGLVKILRAALDKAGISAGMLRFIFPSNVNWGTWKRISDSCGIPFDKFYYPTLSDVGHAHNADPLLNLEHALCGGLLNKGDFFATLTVGMGSTFGCTIFQH